MNSLRRSIAQLQLAGRRHGCGGLCLPDTWPAVLAEALVDELIARLEAGAACACFCCAPQWAELGQLVDAALEARQ